MAGSYANNPGANRAAEYLGASPPEGYRFAGVDPLKQQEIGQRHARAKANYDIFRYHVGQGNIRDRGYPAPETPDYTAAFKWVKDDRQQERASSGSAAKPDEESQSRPTPPSPSFTDARNRAESFLARGSARRAPAPDLNPESRDFYTNLSKTFSARADDVDNRYSKYFDNQSALQAAEIGYGAEKAISSLPKDLALTKPLSQDSAIAYAKDLALIATGQYSGAKKS